MKQMERAIPSKLTPSEVFRRNFLIPTSGVEHGPVLEYAIKVLGVDSIMWAIDYPYEAMAPAVEFMNTANLAKAGVPYRSCLTAATCPRRVYL